MKPMKFDGYNVIFAANQPEYIPLPAHRDEEGLVTTRWKMTLRERIAALFLGRVTIEVLTWGNPFHPLKVTFGWNRRVADKEQK